MLIPRTVTGALLALAAWSCAGTAQAADIDVTSCSEGALRAAVDAAANGDTLRFVCDGTIPLQGAPITLNKTLTLDAAGRSVTIAGRGGDRVFFISTAGADPVTLRGLTIRNGQNPDTATAGGGGIFHASGTLVLDGVRMVGNHAQAQGGAVRSFGTTSRLVVRDSVFEGNSVTCGAVCGNAGGGGAIMAAGVRGALIERSVFRGNETAGMGSGGAIWTPVIFNAALEPVVIRDSLFEDNVATAMFLDATRPSRGGGAIANVDRETVIERNVFRRNVARPYGSAVQIEGGAIRMAGLEDPTFPGKPATIVDNVLEDNAALGPGSRGGAISISGRTMTLRGMRAVGNRSAEIGGALAATLATVDVRDALLSDNRAGGDGAGFTGSAIAALGSTFTVARVDVAGGDGTACGTVTVGGKPGAIVEAGDNFEAPGTTCGFAAIARPTLTAGTAAVRAPRDGTAATVDVPVTLSAALPYDLRVGWSRADGTTGVVEIPAGSLTATVPVVVRGSSAVEVPLTLPEGGRAQLAGDGIVRVTIAAEPVPAQFGPAPAATPVAPAPAPAATPRGCRGTQRVTYRPGGGRTVLSAVRLTRSGAAKPVLFTRTRVVVDLRNLRKGTYTVRVKLRTKAGRTRTVLRRYAVCGG